METFRLEFSEEQQAFHYSNKYDKPNSNGYITLIEKCNYDIANSFMSFINFETIQKYTSKNLINQSNKFTKCINYTTQN